MARVPLILVSTRSLSSDGNREKWHPVYTRRHIKVRIISEIEPIIYGDNEFRRRPELCVITHVEWLQ